MTAINPFVLEKTQYKRDLNVLKMYIDDSVKYLTISTGQPDEVCRKFVLDSMKPGGQFEFKDPVVYYLERNEHGDRDKKACGLSEYLAHSIQESQLIAPTFTTYLPPKTKRALLVDFIDINVKLRGVAKKAMFVAKMAGDHLLEFLKKTEQGNKKIANNSISGAHVSNSTPLFNKTAHSTLTSNCRVTSGFGNANNEKFLCGNRHYWNPKITLNNVVSIVNHSNYANIADAMRIYGIRAPTVDETMACITYSTDLYWRNVQSTARIRQFVEKLSDAERSAFVYTGDLYHLAKYNDDPVRKFITRLAMPVREACLEPKKVIKDHREEYRLLACQLFPVEMKGMTMEKIQGTELEQWIASTVVNIHNTILDYATLIEAFWVTENVPASLAFLPDSIRRAALTSDTDSTIFTVQDWVFWHRGQNPGFTPETSGTAAVMIFLAAETITHVLARMSANFGIETDRMHQVAMKNEFKFDVFIPTQVGKHYFAYISSQEGNIFSKYEKETKGVHLKSSNVPKIIIDQLDLMQNEIMDTIIANKKISLKSMLKKVGDIEREIQRSVIAGEPTYFRTAQIKSADSYTKGEADSPYQHFTLWQEVFAPKYGDAPLPPYSASKVCVDLKSPTSMREWVEKIKDRDLADRLQGWLTRTGKAGVQTLLVPQQCLALKGMPVEITEVMDMRKTIFDNTGSFYLVLETLGFYCVNDNKVHLVSDLH